MSVAGGLYFDREEGDEGEESGPGPPRDQEALEAEKSAGLPGSALITAFNLALATARYADLTAGERPVHMERLIAACDRALAIWDAAE